MLLVSSRRRVLVLLLCVVVVHVTCQPFLPEIRLHTLAPGSSRNQKKLVCVIRTLEGYEVEVTNTEFYLNGSDVRGMLTGNEYDLVAGRITFELTQKLEGYYTCGNSSFESPEEDALKLVCKLLYQL